MDDKVYYQSFEDEWVEEHSLSRKLMEQLVKLFDAQKDSKGVGAVA